MSMCFVRFMTALNLKADKTVVMIAHTLPIIKNADQILVLDHGRIAEARTHDQLVNGSGKYAARLL